MALPAAWPPRPHSSLKSLRFYVTGVSTANFSDNAYMFASGGSGSANTFTPLPSISPAQTISGVTATSPTVVVPSIAGTGRADINPNDGSLPPLPQVWSMGIRICNDGVGDMEYSFDGTNVHGRVKASEVANFYRRHEAGICWRGVGGATPTVRVEAY